MRISLFQMDSQVDNIEFNIKKMIWAAEKASDNGSDILVLPEFWSTGYDLNRLSFFSKEKSEKILNVQSEIADKYSIAVIGSTPFLRNGKIFNTAFFYGKDGQLKASYNKIHLFSLMDEHNYINQGDEITVFQTGQNRAGLAICFDLRFPELFRMIAHKGAKIVFIPAYWPAPRLEHWRILLKARAIENQIFIVGCNRCRIGTKMDFGFSAVIDPEGKVIAEAGTDEILLYADLDIKCVDKVKESFNILNSRRLDIY